MIDSLLSIAELASREIFLVQNAGGPWYLLSFRSSVRQHVIHHDISVSSSFFSRHGLSLTSLSSVRSDDTDKELFRVAVGLHIEPSVLIGVKLRLTSVYVLTALMALTALYGAALLSIDDGRADTCGLPRGVGGNLEPFIA